jgi:hypothetical protein
MHRAAQRISPPFPLAAHGATDGPINLRSSAACRAGGRALCRTRTGDPFLTMEVLYQLS